MGLISENDPPKVFISYSHDSETHREKVLAFANRLITDGLDCQLDQYLNGSPPQGWPRWMEEQIEWADFVLVICTETYLQRFRAQAPAGTGKGVKWEGAIITQQLYEAEAQNRKFIPVIFSASDATHIPIILRSGNHYNVSDEEGYELLYRFLTGQPLVVKPAPGKKKTLSPKQVGEFNPVISKTGSATGESKPMPPNFAHTYPIQKNFTGRVRERQMLTEWLTSSDKPVFAFIAIGGMGKSALTWAWVQRDVLGDALPSAAPDDPADLARCRVPEDQRPTGVLWWSFYEREASFAAFAKQALVYASRGAIKLDDVPSTAEQVRALLPLLREQRLLLVLDGFERELRAYASLSATYQGDAVTEDARGEYRAATSPHAAWFLQAIGAQALQSRVLLTSRLLPRELDELAGCERLDLDSLDPADAVAFFQAQGVRGTRVEIEEACQPYGYHPLSLRLLAGVILKDKRTPGEVQVAKHYAIVPELKGREQHHILQVSYDTLDEQQRTLLSQIAAFRSPMIYDALSILNPCDSEAQFDAALDELIERGWLFFDREQARYDMHPVARQYAYDRLTDKEGVHTRLSDYFANVPTPDGGEVRSVEDLETVIELYHHTVRAGRYDEAQGLFHGRLAKWLYHRFSAQQTRIELLRALFPDGEDILPRLEDRAMQAWTLNALANSYSIIGQPRRAGPLFKKAKNICENQVNDKHYLAVSVGYLAHMSQLPLGELASAEQNLQYRIELCREIRNKFWEASGHRELGRLRAYQGNFNEAAHELDAAQALFIKLGTARAEGVVWAYRVLHTLLMRDAKAAMDSARRARELADVRGDERDIIRAEWLLGAALIAKTPEAKDQQIEFRKEAETHLAEALTRCRRINLVELEPDILLAWARLHHARGDATQALKDAQEAISVADRCEYRLKQAEIHNFLAQLATEAAQPQVAIRHAQQAYERAWCDGPPYCYKPALEEAERRLQALGAPAPKL